MGKAAGVFHPPVPRLPAAHNGQRQAVSKIGQVPPDIKRRRRVINLPQGLGITRVFITVNLDFSLFALLQQSFGPIQRKIPQRRPFGLSEEGKSFPCFHRPIDLLRRAKPSASLQDTPGGEPPGFPEPKIKYYVGHDQPSFRPSVVTGFAASPTSAKRRPRRRSAIPPPGWE